MLECGLVTTKSVSTIAAKNIGKFAIASIVFFLCGYNLAYGIPEGGYIGSFSIWSDSSEIGTGYSDYSDWFYQAMFVCATVSIVSGAVAERIKIWPFFIFSAIMAAFIYPISMGWQWGGGWLASIGFSDFAGSTLVHSTGGAAALAGALMLGPRLGRFTKSGAPAPLKPFAASSIPLVTVGVFILWLGWFGFNGGSQLAVHTVDNANAVAQVFLNTNAAAAGGVLGAIIISKILTGKMDVTMGINGAIAGLVAITAAPDTPSGGLATIIGAIGGVIVYFSVVFFDSVLNVDDPVGAISAHGTVGVWGIMATPLSGAGAFGTQAIGAVSIFLWTFIT